MRNNTRKSRASLLLAPLVIALLAWPAADARAANGDNLRLINADTTGTACADSAVGFKVGVGLAFDGTSLLVSCYNDSSVTPVSPVDGSQAAAPHFISGASSLGALAWDNGRHVLWACSAFNTVGTIDLTTDVFTPKFTVPGCFDGLAYDGADDTVWTSPDATSEVTHSSVLGATLGTFYPALGNCGNSGIAVGGSLLSLANNGCSEIYTSPKDFSASPAFFASFPARLEDMECDNITFAGVGKNAMWSKDAYDNNLNAWEIPVGSCSFGGGGQSENHGRMTGGGSVIAGFGRVTHGFELHCTPDDGANNLEVNWGNGNRFHLTSLTSASCTDDAAIVPNPPSADFDTFTGAGSGAYNGTAGATVAFTFTDAGEPGKNDTATLTIKDSNNAVVLTVAGKLNRGNQQAHDAK